MMWGHGSPGPQPERFIPPAVVTSRHRGWSDRGERPTLGHQVDALEARSARTGPQVSCLGPIRPNSSVQLLLTSASTRGTRAAMEGEESVLASRDAPIGSIWTAANRTASPDLRIDGPDSRVTDWFVVTPLKGSCAVLTGRLSMIQMKPPLGDSLGYPLSAAAGGGTAALAEVAGPGRPHLGAAGEAQRCVCGLTDNQLEQLGGRTRPT